MSTRCEEYPWEDPVRKINGFKYKYRNHGRCNKDHGYSLCTTPNVLQNYNRTSCGTSYFGRPGPAFRLPEMNEDRATIQDRISIFYKLFIRYRNDGFEDESALFDFIADLFERHGRTISAKNKRKFLAYGTVAELFKRGLRESDFAQIRFSFGSSTPKASRLFKNPHIFLTYITSLNHDRLLIHAGWHKVMRNRTQSEGQILLVYRDPQNWNKIRTLDVTSSCEIGYPIDYFDKLPECNYSMENIISSDLSFQSHSRCYINPVVDADGDIQKIFPHSVRCGTRIDMDGRVFGTLFGKCKPRIGEKPLFLEG